MKRSFTLIEMMVALALTAILLTTLFQTLWEITTTKKSVQKLQHLSAERERLFFRLAPIFAKLAKPPKVSQDGIALSYDNGYDRDPKFRGRTTSLLYLEDKTLKLATWGEEEAVRREVLACNVSDLNLSQFFPSLGSWEAEIPEEDKECPLMYKLTIGSTSFPFWVL